MQSLSTLALAIRESVIQMKAVGVSNTDQLTGACEQVLRRSLRDVADPAALLEQVVLDVFSGMLDAFRNEPMHYAVAVSCAATAVMRTAIHLGADAQRITTVAVHTVRKLQQESQLGADALEPYVDQAMTLCTSPPKQPSPLSATNNLTSS